MHQMNLPEWVPGSTWMPILIDFFDYSSNQTIYPQTTGNQTIKISKSYSYMGIFKVKAFFNDSFLTQYIQVNNLPANYIPASNKCLKIRL